VILSRGVILRLLDSLQPSIVKASSRWIAVRPSAWGSTRRPLRRALHPHVEKGTLLWVQIFETVEELRLALLALRDRHDREMVTGRHGRETPTLMGCDQGRGVNIINSVSTKSGVAQL
jgi:hypothetical protein